MPLAPSSITLIGYTADSLSIAWSVPTNTGIGGTTKPILNYNLQVDENFGAGFIDLSEQTTTSYTHLNLIKGHVYSYRVKAENFLGYGAYSTAFTFTPIEVPGKPLRAPRNVVASTYRNTIFIVYDASLNTGGSAITSYKIYVDDGLNGAFGSAINNGLLTTYNTALLGLTSGRKYKLKFSASNAAGEGPQSDEAAILMAEVPSVPTSLQRIDQSLLSAG